MAIPIQQVGESLKLEFTVFLRCQTEFVATLVITFTVDYHHLKCFEFFKPTGNCNHRLENSRLQTGCLQTGRFEMPRFPCSELQRLD